MPTSAEAQMQDANPAVESVASTAAPAHHDDPKPKAPRKRQDSSTKLQKRVEVLQNKVERLMEQNKKLKDECKVLKSAHSRVHRIPKRTT